MFRSFDPGGRLEADHASAVVVPGYDVSRQASDVDRPDMTGLARDRNSI
jgi:hypothetical protein